MGGSYLAALPYAAVLGLLMGAAMTRLALALAVRGGMVDVPGHRRSHSVSTPRGGGLGPVLALLVVGPLALWPLDPQGQVAFAGAIALIATLGWLDDRRSVPAPVRFAIQGVVAAALAWFALRVPGGLPLAAVVVLIVASMNAHNFMDGINGIAATQFIAVGLALAGLAWHGGQVDLAWLALCGACAMLGFLPFNFPRARVFMGDVGSTAFGLWLAFVALALVMRGTLSVGGAAVLVSAFATDSGATLVMRALRGKRWWRAHREHLYQWLTRVGWSHARVTSTYLGWHLLVALPLALVHESLWRGRPPATSIWHTLGYTAGIPVLAYVLSGGIWLRGKRWCRDRYLGRV